MKIEGICTAAGMGGGKAGTYCDIMPMVCFLLFASCILLCQSLQKIDLESDCDIIFSARVLSSFRNNDSKLFDYYSSGQYDRVILLDIELEK